MRRALPIVLLAVAAARADTPLESWNIFEIPLLQKGRVTTSLHASFRVRDGMSDLYYGRFGPNIRVRLTGRVSLLGGFWYADQERPWRTNWDDMHRLWGGFERPFRAGTAAVQVRGLYEHWFAGPKANDNRTRWMVMYRRPIGRGMTLNAGSETFTDKHGYCAERLIASVGFPVSGGFVLETGYMWDRRLERIGGPRQMITTTFRSRSRER